MQEHGVGRSESKKCMQLSELLARKTIIGVHSKTILCPFSKRTAFFIESVAVRRFCAYIVCSQRKDMSEENMNENVVMSETTEVAEPAEVEASQPEAADETVEIAEDLSNGSDDSEDGVMTDEPSEAVLEAEEAVAEAVEEAEPVSEEEEVDLSHMSWEDRVEHFMSRESVEGYAKALRLVDFHNPGDFLISERWAQALQAHPEFALGIFEGVMRYISSEKEVWEGILQAHESVFDDASEPAQEAIREVMGLIKCLRVGDVDGGRADLENTASRKGLLEALALVPSGNWRKVETAVTAALSASGIEGDALAVEAAHVNADIALSIGALDRAVQYVKTQQRKSADDLTLKWRLCILQRDTKKWPAYVDCLAKELIHAVERVEEKVDVYGEMIRIYRDETKQDAMVTKTYEALLGIDPDNSDALESLMAIYERNKKWPDLIKVIESQAERSEGERKVDFYLRIARIYLENLNRKVDAIKYYEFVLQADPAHSESIEKLKALYTERRDYANLIEVHKKELLLIDDVSSQITLLRSMAEVAEKNLRKNEVAIDIWNMVLEREAYNTDAIDALEKLYEKEKRYADLAGISEKRIDLTQDDKVRFDLLQKLGLLYSDKAKDLESAVGAWRRVLAIDPGYTKGVDNLRKLLIELRDWQAIEDYYTENDILADLVKLFEQLSKSQPEADDKKQLLLRTAHVYENALGESDSAMGTLEKILEIDANDATAAAELVGYYEARDKNEELAHMLEILHASCAQGEERSAYGLRLASLCETKLSDDNRAYAWYLKVVQEDVRYSAAYDGLERTSGKTGHAQVVVDLYHGIMESSDEAEFIRELRFRVGRLLFEYLGQSKAAQDIFEALLAENNEDVRALGALENILDREGRFDELLEVNTRRMELARTPEDKAETLLMRARINENQRNDKEGAIQAYECVCELLPESTRPLVELHRLYAETEAYEQLARVIEKQLELLGADNAFSEERSEAEVIDEGLVGIVYGAKLERHVDDSDGEAVETVEWVERSCSGLDADSVIALWAELGRVYRDALSEYEAAVECFDNILLLDIDHEESISSLEALLANDVCVEEICRTLSRVYDHRENYEGLQNVIVRLAGCQSDSRDKISYLIRASQINREILENTEATLGCLSAALLVDPSCETVKQVLLEIAESVPCWERVVSILEEVALSIRIEEGEENLLATQYAIDLSVLWENQLANREKAIEYGRKALALGMKNPEVLDFLLESFQRLESWENVIDVLKAKRDLAIDDEALVLEINMQIASIQENFLNKHEDAINTLLEILDVHSDNLDVMKSLDHLYATTQRWADAVSNYERRLDLTEDDDVRDEIECHRAEILSKYLNEPDSAFEIYSNVIARDASNTLALAGLETMIAANEGSLVEQISEIILPIYDALDDWEKRCWTDEQLLRVVEEPERRRDLLHEIANLCEENGGDHERAYEAYARSLREDLTSQATIDSLVNFADVLDKWADLVKVMEDASADTENLELEAVKNIRGMVAVIYREHLDNIDAAIKTYVDIRELDPDNVDIEILNALQELYLEKENWKALCEILGAKAAAVDDQEERKQLLFQSAAIFEDQLGDVESAITIHNEILEFEAGEQTALDSLERLYLGQERWQDLYNVYSQKIEIAEDDETRIELYVKQGVLQETKLEDNPGAIETYNQVLALLDSESRALEALDRLYIGAEDWDSLLDILERREAVCEDDEARIEFKFRQAECDYRNRKDVSTAIEVYHAVFELNPEHEASIASLEEIISHAADDADSAENAAAAARVLVPVYQGLGRAKELVKVYEVLVSASTDNEEAIELLGYIGQIEKDYLENPKAAFDAWYRALALDAARDATWEIVEQLAAECECFQELVDKLDALKTDLSSEGEICIIISKHMAAIYEQALQAPEKAVDALRSILEIDQNEKAAIQDLDRLYESLERWNDLAELLAIEIEIAESDEERLGFWYKLGAVQEQYLQNYEDAVNSYNEMLMIVPVQAEAMEALIRIFEAGHCCTTVAAILEPIYRDNEAWDQLVALDLQLVEHLEDHNDRYDKLIEVADVYLDQLASVAESLDIYGRALVERPGDDLCLAKMDELSEIVQSWEGNVPYLKRACDASEDDLIKLDLTLRMARIYFDKLSDPENAERCFLDVLKFDAEHLESLKALDQLYLDQTRWEDLVAIIHREIPVVDSDEERIELNMRLGTILFDMLQKGDEAIEAYHEVLNIEVGHWEALSALEKIYESREDWQSVYDTFEKMAAASNDDDQRVELWGRQAYLASEVLQKTEEAIDLWYQVIDTLGDNISALQNLEVLFTRQERWTDVADVVERQVPLYADAQDEDNQLEAYRKLGRIYRDKLEENDRSRDYWRNALEVNSADLETLRALEALDEVLEDQEDLAEVLLQLLNASILSAEDQLACAVKLAGVRDALGRVDDTIEIWLYIVQLDPNYMPSYAELERLYEGEGRWTDVIATLAAKSEVMPELDDKVALWLRIANIWETQEYNIEQAAAAYMQILAMDPARDSAFELLEKLYTDNEKWPELLNAYVERSNVVPAPASRLDLTFRAAKTAEEKMEDVSTAYQVLLAMVTEFWKNAQFHEEIQRLAAVSQNWPTQIEVYSSLSEESDQDPERRDDSLILHNYLGGWYFTHMHQPDIAWQHLSFVTEQDPTNVSARDIMADCFEQMGNASVGDEAASAWSQQVDILNQRLELTVANDDRVNVLLRIGKTFEVHLGDINNAERAYKQAHTTLPERLDAMAALARVYEAKGMWHDLVAILEEEIAVIEDEDQKCETLYHAGEIFESCLNQAENAAAKYNAVLAINSAHRNALVGAERLDAVLERWEDLLNVYDLQLAAFETDEERIEVYAKKSQVYETKLNRLEDAIDCMTQVTLIQSDNIMGIEQLERLYELAERWQDLISELNTHIDVLPDASQHVELYRRLGVVFRDKVADATSAIDCFLNLISIQPNDVPALYALADLYQAGEDYYSAIDFLKRVIECLSDSTEITDVHYRIGMLNYVQLTDDVSAEACFKTCLEINAGYMPAIDALKQIYEGREDWLSVVKILKQKVEFTRELDEKARINCELGYVSLNHIGDAVNAYPYYEEALSLQPDYVDAAWPLADKCLADESWARALLLIEIVIKGVAYRQESEQLYLFNYKAGYCCQKLAQHDRALEFYRSSYELKQDYTPTLLGMGQELKEAKDYDRAWTMFQNLLENYGDSLTPEDIIAIYYDSAEIKKETNELALARQLLERILEADGSHNQALELMIEVCEQMEDWNALVYYLAIHVDRIENSEDKFLELMKIAKLYGEKLNNVEQQIAYYYRALEIEPTSKVVLNDLLVIYHSNGQWNNAIGVIERLCEGEEDDKKVARYYYTIAVIYRDEIKNGEKAIEYLNHALDMNVNELRAFEAIDRILTASRDWDNLERNYRKMIKRVTDNDSPDLKDTRQLLWYGLGEIYRTRLQQWDNAIAAFKTASELKPNDSKLLSILAELYEKIEQSDNAILYIRKILLNPNIKLTGDEMRQNYFKLFNLYFRRNEFDKAFCVAEVMRCKGIEHANLDVIIDNVFPDDGYQPVLKYEINEQANDLIWHATLDRTFNNAMQRMNVLLQLVTKTEKDYYIVKRKHEFKYVEGQTFWMIFENVLKVLHGGNRKEWTVFLSPDGSYRRGGAPARLKYDAILIGEKLYSGQQQRHAAFNLAKIIYQMCYFPFADLKTDQLLPLVKACLGYFAKRPDLGYDENVNNLMKKLSPPVHDKLEEAFKPIIQNREKQLALSDWRRAAEMTCNRVGLIVCGGDLEAALECIEYDEFHFSSLDKVALKNDLITYALSEEYFEIREGLHIAYGSSQDDD